MTLHRKLYVASFLALLGGLGLGAARSLSDYAMPADIGVLDGGLAQSFESHFNERFPVKQLGINLWAALDYRLFREGRPGVLVGSREWLYSDEEIKPVVGGQRHMQENLELIRGVRETLAHQGVQLVMAVVPAKARLYPEYLGEHRPAGLHTELYREFHTALRAADIVAPDLLDPLRQGKGRSLVFLRTDTHWTPRGAQIVAHQLATEVSRRDLLEETRRFVTETGEAKPHKGDLTNFLPLAPLFEELLPQPDLLVQHSTRPAEEGATAADALFADSQVPVALVGTSYSADERWNFAGALRQALGSDLLNFAEDGHGPILPMLKFLQSEEFKNAPPQVVIWEFPERYLPMANDLKEFDAGWIAQLRAAGGQDQLADNQRRQVRP